MNMWEFFSQYPFCFVLASLFWAIAVTRTAAHISEAVLAYKETRND